MKHMLSPNVVVATVVIATVLFVGLYDAIALMFWGSAYTVSWVLKDWSRHFPILPIVVGIIIGHIFWPVGGESFHQPADLTHNGSAAEITRKSTGPADYDPGGLGEVVRH